LLSKLCCQLKQSLCNQQAPVFSAITCRCQKICQSGCYLTFWLRRQTKTKTIHTSAYLRLRLRRGKASCYTPRWQLKSKAIPFKLDHVIPSDELTHDTMAVGGATKCCNVQQCTCLDADFWLLLYNVYSWFTQTQILARSAAVQPHWACRYYNQNTYKCIVKVQAMVRGWLFCHRFFYNPQSEIGRKRLLWGWHSLEAVHADNWCMLHWCTTYDI